MKKKPAPKMPMRKAMPMPMPPVMPMDVQDGEGLLPMAMRKPKKGKRR